MKLYAGMQRQLSLFSNRMFEPLQGVASRRSRAACRHVRGVPSRDPIGRIVQTTTVGERCSPVGSTTYGISVGLRPRVLLPAEPDTQHRTVAVQDARAAWHPRYMKTCRS